MIVFDFEWNRGYDKTPLHEILQIGAVRLERLGGPVTDIFNVYIRPVVHKSYDPGAKSLPELKQSKASRLSFAQAMEQFRQWCGEETVYGAWGSDDFAMLEENCRFWKVPAPALGTVYDIQRAFAHVLGAEQQIALWRAVDYCRIPDLFEFHNALHDALYTALVGGGLTWEELTQVPEPTPKAKRVPALSELPFPRQPRQKVGPFGAAEEALNARSDRKCACPLCGRAAFVTRWHFAAPRKGAAPQQYYAAFCCPDHGRFLCRMTLSQGPDGLWRGRRCVPEITPELTLEYAAAMRGEVYQCKGEGRRRRRRRRSSPREQSENIT